MFKSILVATDGTTQSNQAVKTAATLATDMGATLIVFHASRTYKSFYYPDGVALAWPPEDQDLEKSSAGADKVLTTASALAKKVGVTAKTAHSYSDSPAEAIIAAARKSSFSGRSATVRRASRVVTIPSRFAIVAE